MYYLYGYNSILMQIDSIYNASCNMHTCVIIDVQDYYDIDRFKTTMIIILIRTAAMAQWVRAFARQVEGWMFESQPQQTIVVKTSCDSSTAKLWKVGASVTGPPRRPL